MLIFRKRPTCCPYIYISGDCEAEIVDQRLWTGDCGPEIVDRRSLTGDLGPEIEIRDWDRRLRIGIRASD